MGFEFGSTGHYLPWRFIYTKQSVVFWRSYIVGVLILTLGTGNTVYERQTSEYSVYLSVGAIVANNTICDRSIVYYLIYTLAKESCSFALFTHVLITRMLRINELYHLHYLLSGYVSSIGY